MKCSFGVLKKENATQRETINGELAAFCTTTTRFRSPYKSNVTSDVAVELHVARNHPVLATR